MRARFLVSLGAGGALVFIMGCTTPSSIATSPLVCDSGDISMVRDALYFGRHRPGRMVTDDEWTEFLNQIITPRFPAGLTIMSAVGQWQNAVGVIEREQSQVVTVVHLGDAASLRAIEEITKEYRLRFEQEAVLRERVPNCVRY